MCKLFPLMRSQVVKLLIQYLHGPPGIICRMWSWAGLAPVCFLNGWEIVKVDVLLNWYKNILFAAFSRSIKCSTRNSVDNHNVVLYFCLFFCATCWNCVDLREIIVTTWVSYSSRDFRSSPVHKHVLYLFLFLCLFAWFQRDPSTVLLNYPILALCFFGYNVHIVCDV